VNEERTTSLALEECGAGKSQLFARDRARADCVAGAAKARRRVLGGTGSLSGRILSGSDERARTNVGSAERVEPGNGSKLAFSALPVVELAAESGEVVNDETLCRRAMIEVRMQF